ncbi:MAG: hypothetical protein NT070_17810 [Cyanobacteria bacterium]|nr:hypothetical protein [Cyanobacteriota bacterium]
MSRKILGGYQFSSIWRAIGVPEMGLIDPHRAWVQVGTLVDGRLTEY